MNAPAVSGTQSGFYRVPDRIPDRVSIGYPLGFGIGFVSPGPVPDPDPEILTFRATSRSDVLRNVNYIPVSALRHVTRGSRKAETGC